MKILPTKSVITTDLRAAIYSSWPIDIHVPVEDLFSKLVEKQQRKGN